MNDQMNSQNIKKVSGLLVLTMIMLLTLIGSASYAYFTSSSGSNAIANVNLNKLPAAGGACTGTGKTNTLIDTVIDAKTMQESANSTSTPKITATSGNIVMTAVPVSASIVTKCTYDITWKFTKGGYTKSSALSSNKELTYTLQKYNTTGSKWDNYVGENNFDTTTNNTAINLKASETLQTTSAGANVTATYRVLIKWYNAPCDQTAHLGKTYAGQLSFSTPTIALT